MSKKRYNHADTYGTYEDGRSPFANVASTHGLHDWKADTASFQFTEDHTPKVKAAMTDIDAAINVGKMDRAIDIFFEFKETQSEYRFPPGQRLSLCQWANKCYITTCALSGHKLGTRRPGTIALVIKAVHPKAPFYDVANIKVSEVYKAHRHCTKDTVGGSNWHFGKPELWENYNDQNITVAQYLELIADQLLAEAPRTEAARKLKAIAKGGLIESGQSSYNV